MQLLKIFKVYNMGNAQRLHVVYLISQNQAVPSLVPWPKLSSGTKVLSISLFGHPQGHFSSLSLLFMIAVLRL